MSQGLVNGLQNGIDELSLDAEAAVGVLKHLQKDELQSLLDDDSRMEQLIQNSEMVEHISNTKQMLMVGNKSIAEYNLSKETRLIESRNMLAETYGQVEELLENIQAKKVLLESRHNQTSLDTLLALLETEAAKTEEHSEELSEQLLSSKMDIGKFVTSYLAARTCMYKQKVKADKLFEIIHRQA